MKVVEDDIRLDKYLSENTEYTRNQIEKMLEQECILVNNKIVKPSYKVKEGDTIDFTKEYVKETKVEPVKMNLNIVYEDEHIMVIDKPSSLVVHPGNGNYNNTLANGLLYYTKNLSTENGIERPGIVHRIDKDTSGLLLIAKTNQAHLILAEDFKEKKVRREYVALLIGVFKNKNAIIDAPIGRDEKDRKRMAVTAKNSKNAITHLKVLKRFTTHTLVRLKLETGRTHQIRVHMKYIGYPIFNDPVYTNKKCTEFGQFLHSASIDFIHPTTNEPMHFEVDVPKYFKEFLDSLEKK